MLRLSASLPLTVALAFGALPAIAWGQMYRCVDKHGHQHYSQTIPRACLGRPIEQLNAQGMVINRILPPPTPAQLKAEKAAKEKAEERAKLRERQERSDQALLATYTSLKDIENTRNQALASNEREVSSIERRVAELQRRRARQEKRLHSFAPGKRPQGLQLGIKETESDLAMEQQLLAAKKREVERINAKYDADAKRYAEITGQSTGASGAGAPAR